MIWLACHTRTAYPRPKPAPQGDRLIAAREEAREPAQEGRRLPRMGRGASGQGDGRPGEAVIGFGRPQSVRIAAGVLRSRSREPPNVK
jgi:hypothetical protein